MSGMNDALIEVVQRIVRRESQGDQSTLATVEGLSPLRVVLDCGDGTPLSITPLIGTSDPITVGARVMVTWAGKRAVITNVITSNIGETRSQRWSASAGELGDQWTGGVVELARDGSIVTCRINVSAISGVQERTLLANLPSWALTGNRYSFAYAPVLQGATYGAGQVPASARMDSGGALLIFGASDPWSGYVRGSLTWTTDVPLA